MITPKEAMENPELMIKHKDDLKDIRIFEDPWYVVFERHPYLYREFSDKFDEMDEVDVSFALRDDPTLVSDLKNHLHVLSGWEISRAVRDIPALILGLKNHLHRLSVGYFNWVLRRHPELSLCIKYWEDVDKVEAAYYIGYPHELDNLNKEEKREMSKKIMELLREEKA